MENLYFYKIKDSEDDTYSEYYACNRRCADIIKKAITKYHKDNGSEGVSLYIEELLKLNNIKFELISWQEMEF